ncbi:hypothetical protein [Streptomyces xiamenensis]|uniref:hypothetical protein n=1 Tax=Streptomyces xiamenensis TaxID=408015 RepID=UPI0035E15691
MPLRPAANRAAVRDRPWQAAPPSLKTLNLDDAVRLAAYTEDLLRDKDSGRI